ncbi:MAG: hypothetical protein DHS20C16_28110 [Phycisphaerae bacterium]|nr:MAG: hypothetical protein DHS20C16_28110 [Phycisphaerae bacterium]
MQATSKNWTKRRIATALIYCVPALAMLVATGCQDPCNQAGVCDDSDACTTDTCTNVDGAAECTNTPVDCAGQLCNPDDGACVDCLADTDCDDAAFCNGDETCADDNTCAAGTDPCAEGESCDEEGDECVASCTDDASCDDGLFCTGVETCDSNGLCSSSGDPCAEGETCNDDTDTCDAPAVDCNSNGDCEDGEECLDNVCVEIAVPDCNSNGDCPDDGLFCNGTESCNTNSFECASSGDPCLATETCNEDTDTCDNNNPSMSFILTNLIDIIMSGPGDDTITGTRDGSADGNTISIGDDIDGQDGHDRANFIVTDNSVPQIDMNNVEELWVRALDNNIDFIVANYNGVTDVAYNNGTQDLELNEFPNLLDLHIIGGDGADDFTVTFADDLLDTADDETINVYVDNADIDTLEIWDENTNNEGPETINIIGCGGTSIIDDIESGDESGDEGGTINITGPDDITLGDLGNAETIDGSAATGDLDISIDNGNDVTIQTGSGDDIIRTGANLDDMDDVDAGTGNDRLITNSAVTVEDLTVAGVEEWEISGGITVDFDNVTPGTIIITGNNNTVADNVAKNTPITLYGTLANSTINVDGAGSVGSNSDALTITLGEDETAATVGTSDIIIPDVETLNFVSMEAANDAGDLNADSCAALNVTGDEDFQIDVLAASAALNTVDASGLGGALDVDLSLITQDSTIIGSDDDDTIAVNDNATTDATIVGGAGADAIDLGGATATSIQTIAYLSVDDLAADIDEDLTDADVVGLGDEFDVSDDVVEISGALRTALAEDADNNNTAAGAADLDVSGLFFFNVGADLGANGANSDVFATVNAAIGALANETVGDTAVFAVLNSNADDGMAVYLFVSDSSDGVVTQDELQLMGYFDSDAACTAANINLN